MIQCPRNDIGELIALLPSWAKVVELGSFTGGTARQWLASNKVATLYCIDAWEGGYDPDDLASNANMRDAEAEFDTLKDGRLVKLKMRTTQAATMFPDASIDLVYIDADHRFPAVVADLRAWLPKVKGGGYIAGHDYNQPNHPGVKAAVDLWVPSITTHAMSNWSCRL